MPDRTQKLLSSTPTWDSETNHLRTIPAYTIFAALRDLASLVNAKFTPYIPPTVLQSRPVANIFALADMKSPPSAIIAFITKNTTRPSEKDMLDSPSALISTNNIRSKTPLSSEIDMDDIDNKTTNMNRLDNESEIVQSSRHRLMRKDSGFSSSGSDEDATDRGSKCHCDTVRNRLRPCKPQRQQPHWLSSLSRSQSWSSLDSAFVDTVDQPGPYSVSESSSSPLSSVWSLTSSRNNLSLSPSLDSQLWGSALISYEDTAVLAGTSPKVPTSDNNRSQANTNRSSEITNNNSERSSLFSEELDRDEESVGSTTQVISGDESNIAVRRIPTETDAVLPRPSSEQSYRQIRVRRRPHGRDHNNNRGARHGIEVREYLPDSPGRLGDCFKKNGLLSLAALIIYTLTLMVVFGLLGMVGKSLKTAVGKQDLKEMRRSLAQTRRSRRAPATSG